MTKQKIVSLVIGLLFLSFAIVQYNDPDPWEWIAMYGVISLTGFFSAFGIYNRWFAYFLLVVSLIWMIFLFPGLWQWIMYEPVDALIYDMSPEKMYIEDSREFLGLLMGLIAVFLIVKQNRIS